MDNIKMGLWGCVWLNYRGVCPHECIGAYVKGTPESFLLSTRWKTDRPSHDNPEVDLTRVQLDPAPWALTARLQNGEKCMCAGGKPPRSCHGGITDRAGQRGCLVPGRQSGFHGSPQLVWNCSLCTHWARGSFSVLLAPTWNSLRECQELSPGSGWAEALASLSTLQASLPQSKRAEATVSHSGDVTMSQDCISQGLQAAQGPLHLLGNP